ncbi:hypothetical protein BD770DRAFT_415845 [Pilaira anomala]|nr:hypothetical protein BD770DRAFT_415845 [Pilaira anomala]
MHATLLAKSLLSVDPDSLSFNESQSIAYQTIRDRALDESYFVSNDSSNAFFIDGPGGTLDEASMISKDLIETQVELSQIVLQCLNKANFWPDVIKLNLTVNIHVLGHGQLYYVALSRVRTSSVKIIIEPAISKIPNKDGHYAHNIVFKKIQIIAYKIEHA